MSPCFLQDYTLLVFFPSSTFSKPVSLDLGFQVTTKLIFLTKKVTLQITFNYNIKI